MINDTHLMESKTTYHSRGQKLSTYLVVPEKVGVGELSLFVNSGGDRFCFRVPVVMISGCMIEGLQTFL